MRLEEVGFGLNIGGDQRWSEGLPGRELWKGRPDSFLGRCDRLVHGMGATRHLLPLLLRLVGLPPLKSDAYEKSRPHITRLVRHGALTGDARVICINQQHIR